MVYISCHLILMRFRNSYYAAPSHGSMIYELILSFNSLESLPFFVIRNHRTQTCYQTVAPRDYYLITAQNIEEAEISLLLSIFPVVLIVSPDFLIWGWDQILRWFFFQLTIIRKPLDGFSLSGYVSSSVQCRRIPFGVKGQRFQLAWNWNSGRHRNARPLKSGNLEAITPLRSSGVIPLTRLWHVTM